jgi:hypothetical protein
MAVIKPIQNQLLVTEPLTCDNMQKDSLSWVSYSTWQCSKGSETTDEYRDYINYSMWHFYKGSKQVAICCATCSMKKSRESAILWLYYKTSFGCPLLAFCCISDYNIMNQTSEKKVTLCEKLKVKSYVRWHWKKNYSRWMWSQNCEKRFSLP